MLAPMKENCYHESMATTTSHIPYTVICGSIRLHFKDWQQQLGPARPSSGVQVERRSSIQNLCLETISMLLERSRYWDVFCWILMSHTREQIQLDRKSTRLN